MSFYRLKAKQPYLVRAYYYWLCDSGLTPYCLVDTQCEGVVVPQRYVQHNQIILNLNPAVCGAIGMDGSIIQCTLRFEKVRYSVRIPMVAVKAIYAKENGLGIGFDQQDEFFELGERTVPETHSATESASKSDTHQEPDPSLPASAATAEANRRNITLLK